MKNYKMIITYDGTRYYGWEHQPTTDMTIQGKLESVLSAMTGTEVEVIGAGRTDAGVHAKAAILHILSRQMVWMPRTKMASMAPLRRILSGS